MFQVFVDCVREYSSLADFQISFSTYSADRFGRNIGLNQSTRRRLRNLLFETSTISHSCSLAIQWNRSRFSFARNCTFAIHGCSDSPQTNCPICERNFRSLRTTVRPQNSAWRIIAFAVPRHVTRPINKDGRVNTPRACLIVRLRYYRLRCILAIRLTAGTVCASAAFASDLLRCEIVHALARTVRK